MKKTNLLLFILIASLSAACTPQILSTPTQIPTHEQTPLPAPATDSAPTAESNTQALSSAWKEIRDPRFGFGLAVPCWWIVNPMPVEGYIASMGIRSYDDAFFAANSEKGFWKNSVVPQGAVSMDITAATGIDPSLSMVEAYMQFVDTTSSAFVSSEERQVGNHIMTLITLQNLLNPAEPNTTGYVVGLAPDAILIFNTYPANAINSSDVQAILTSFAGVQDEPVTLPTVQPSPALTDPSCSQ